MEHVVKMNVIRSEDDNVSENYQKTILNDFYNSLSFSYKYSEQISDIVYMYEQIELLLETRLYAHYEDAYRAQNKSYIKDIRRDNKMYEKELIELINTMEGRKHISFVDYVFIMSAKRAIAEKENTLTTGAFSVSDVRTKANHNAIELKKGVFKALSGYEINLGTKELSKSNTNSRIAKITYGIICKGEYSDEFNECIQGKKPIKDLSPELKFLVNKVGVDGVNKIIYYSKKRNFVLESLLLQFIVLGDIYKYDPEILKDYIDEDTLDSIKLQAESDTEEQRSKLYLRQSVRL